MIERFEAAVKYCNDQGVTTDENTQKRMLLARPAERYTFLKQSYKVAPAATRPTLVGLKAQLRDIDSEFQKTNSIRKKASQANMVNAESAWSQGTSQGAGRGSSRGKPTDRGGRGKGVKG